MSNKNPLLDAVFLSALNKNTSKEVYAKIISLTQDEAPIESIEGKVTKGTINIDGSSKVQRTCNLTLVTNNVNIHNVYWGLTNKFKLLIGVANKVDPSYDSIIWFPQGIYVINSFKVSTDTKKCNITISGMDKLCLLSGDIGGVIPVATDFAAEEIVLEDGSIQKNFLPIKHIIKEMIHYYGNEPFHNIILKDVDDIGLEQLDYIGEDNIYFFRTIDGRYVNMTFDKTTTRYNLLTDPPSIVEIGDEDIIYYSLSPNADNSEATKVTDDLNNGEIYQIVRCSPGEASGYRTIDLVWPQEDGLIAQAGDTVISVLDKICKQFSDYEYFYDVEGHFVFQKKLTYVNTSWNNLITIDNNDVYIESEKIQSQYSFDFSDSSLIQSINNNPDFKNLKNDFAIWGKKKSTSSSSSSSSDSSVNDPLAIHLRYAIHEKPAEYVDYNGKHWIAGEKAQIVSGNLQVSDNVVDWRELIYLMAVDYFAHNHDDDFAVHIARNNPQYPYGITKYEQYYPDMLQFWRYLYNPYITSDNEDYQNYFMSIEDDDFNPSYFGWNKIIVDDPSQLKFWIDFLDPQGGALSKYSVSALGSRGKVINEDSIKAIVYKDIPPLVYVSAEKYEEMSKNNLLLSGYTYIKMPSSFDKYFQRSVQSSTAQQRLDDLLYKHLFLNDKISLKTIPIYQIQPNTKILISNLETGVNGEYIVNKISLNLGHQGMMSINASKAPKRLY